MIDIKKVKEEAQREVYEEKMKEAKAKVKKKMQELESAKVIVKNLERELEDIYATISEGV